MKTTKTLRTGFTTGACAAAAALGAARMLREQERVAAVELWLPAGFSATFSLHGQAFDQHRARCFVIKDAGDDPDVTNGVEVQAEVALAGADPRVCPSVGEGPGQSGRIKGFGPPEVVIEGGLGIGRVTKKGLAVPVGEWAINPVPRRMIAEAVLGVFPPHASPLTPHVVISIPDGVERAKRTLNARLGIVGGLSILGTTGVVTPISHRAWTDTLEVALDVARAAGLDTVVFSTGRTSEAAAQRALPLPEEAFVMMGDHVGYALEACHRRGMKNVILAVQFAKLVKIACGHDNTHAAASHLDLGRLAAWARACDLDDDAIKTIECAGTAREIFKEATHCAAIAAIAAERALTVARRRIPEAAVAVLLVGYDGAPPLRFGEWPG